MSGRQRELHRRLQLELLTLRSRSLEQWVEEQVSRAVAREEQARSDAAALQAQVRTLTQLLGRQPGPGAGTGPGARAGASAARDEPEPGEPGEPGAPPSPHFGREPDEGRASLEELQRMLQGARGPHAARLWARIGQLHQRARAFAEARAAYNAAVRLEPTQHGCIANLAQLEAHCGRFSDARDLLQRALHLDPGNEAYLSFRGWLADVAAARSAI